MNTEDRRVAAKGTKWARVGFQYNKMIYNR